MLWNLSEIENLSSTMLNYRMPITLTRVKKKKYQKLKTERAKAKSQRNEKTIK
jgi:hypothetical protein